MDGIRSSADAPMVVVLATTNRPWDLDEALRRRLEKRIFVPLPDEVARAQVLRLQLAGVRLEADVAAEWIAQRTEGFSGADLKVLCRDASMMPMRRLIAQRSQAEILALKGSGDLQARARRAARGLVLWGGRVLARRWAGEAMLRGAAAGELDSRGL